jgi:hypothetical protein
MKNGKQHTPTPPERGIVKAGERNAALTVYDAENACWIEVSHDQQRMAAYVHQQMLMGVFVTANAIKKVFDERLYLALGCQSREEYIATMLPMNRSQAYKYHAIATKFESASKLLSDGEIKPIDLSNGSVLVHSSGLEATANNLGIQKLYELSSLEDDEFAELIKSGKIKGENGEIDLQDIVDATAKEAKKQIADFKKKYSDKINQQDEEIKLLREERKQLVKERDENKELADDLKTDLHIYGPNATKLKDKAAHLAVAGKLFNEAHLAVVKANVMASDPLTLRQDLANMIKKIDEVRSILADHYSEILAEVE